MFCLSLTAEVVARESECEKPEASSLSGFAATTSFSWQRSRLYRNRELQPLILTNFNNTAKNF